MTDTKAESLSIFGQNINILYGFPATKEAHSIKEIEKNKPILELTRQN